MKLKQARLTFTTHLSEALLADPVYADNLTILEDFIKNCTPSFNVSELFFQDLTSAFQALSLSKHHEGLEETSTFICELTLVTDQEIQEINQHYRDINQATNVLAFPQFDPESPETLIANQIETPLSLGDVVVAVPYALSEAQQLNSPQLDHLLQLLIHGLAHLFGFDHQSPTQEQKMLEIEKQLALLLFPERLHLISLLRLG